VAVYTFLDLVDRLYRKDKELRAELSTADAKAQVQLFTRYDRSRNANKETWDALKTLAMQVRLEKEPVIPSFLLAETNLSTRSTLFHTPLPSLQNCNPVCSISPSSPSRPSSTCPSYANASVDDRSRIWWSLIGKRGRIGGAL
jgi:hypothetical protein